MWSCAGNRKRLSAHIDAELPERVRRSVEDHLARCPACRSHFEDLLMLEQRLEQYHAPPLPAGLTTRILAEAASRKRGRKKIFAARWKWQTYLPQPWPAKVATTAALVVGLAMGAWMGWTGHPRADSGQWASLPNIERSARSLYAFDVLGAEPRGSIEAATLALLKKER